MVWRLLADVVLVTHLLFIVFAVGGGLLALRWNRVAWGHVPCALWAAGIALLGWICPLTPLEVSLRRLGGEAGYSGGFIEHYLVPVIYPPGLTREIQIGLGAAVILLNAIAYAILWRRRSIGS